MKEELNESLAWIEDALTQVISESNETYTYEEVEVQAAEIAACDGLLPLVIENIRAIHEALGIDEQFLHGIDIVEDGDSLLNKRVVLTEQLHNPSIMVMAAADRLRMLREMNNAASKLRLEWLERPANASDINNFMMLSEQYIRQSARLN